MVAPFGHEYFVYYTFISKDIKEGKRLHNLKYSRNFKAWQ